MDERAKPPMKNAPKTAAVFLQCVMVVNVYMLAKKWGRGKLTLQRLALSNLAENLYFYNENSDR